ncbi:MAG TPA: YeeE/YedE family protein [Aquabacterium sp.]|uniref:YeeE/YedE family protein n=1 Tax=Aquabacterium sp. TaxID=1872578 RepID=UPI002E319CF2|nr:YeeE/YedE family protein [Aquabacterium sp.]HEX5356502.1 YeeE/YedE family protein [Aquabacterium sp.]
MIRLLTCLLSGALFGLGLAIAQMTNPLKVQNFLDVAGHWDPSLAFVMGAAVMITLVGFRVVLRRQAPLLGERFHLPTLVHVDRQLVLGSALFGIGWGLTGYCPGPALATLLSGNDEVYLFVPAMLLGGFLHRKLARRA